MRKFAAACVLALALVGCCCARPAYGSTDASPNPFDQIVPLTQVGDAPPSTRFIDQRGDAVRFADLRGNAVAIAFVYTRCRDACPIITQKFALVRQLVAGVAARLVEVTIDPEHDNGHVATEYARRNGMKPPQWLFLTGLPADVDDFNRRMGVQAIASGPAEIIHNDRVVIVSADGRVTDIIEGSSWTPADLAAELRHDAGSTSSPLARLDLALGAALAFCGGALSGRAGIGDLVASMVVLGGLAFAFVWFIRRTSSVGP